MAELTSSQIAHLGHLFGELERESSWLLLAIYEVGLAKRDAWLHATRVGHYANRILDLLALASTPEGASSS